MKSIQMKATEQYFPAVLFIMLYAVQGGSTFKCDLSNESYSVVFFCGAICFVVKVVLIFESADKA